MGDVLNPNTPASSRRPKVKTVRMRKMTTTVKKTPWTDVTMTKMLKTSPKVMRSMRGWSSKADILTFLSAT